MVKKNNGSFAYGSLGSAGSDYASFYQFVGTFVKFTLSARFAF
jgi:hypothetical protein